MTQLVNCIYTPARGCGHSSVQPVCGLLNPHYDADSANIISAMLTTLHPRRPQRGGTIITSLYQI